MATDGWVIVQLEEGENMKVSKVIPATYEKTFNAILEEIAKEMSFQENETPRVFVKAEGKDISHDVQLDMPMCICKVFSCNVIVFFFTQKERLEKQNVTKTRTQKGGLLTIKRFKALVLNVIHSIKM